MAADHELSYTELLAELKNCRAELSESQYQLEEANHTLEAIRSGEVDALVIKANDGHQLYTLQTADLIYRIFIEQMNEGAVTLNAEGQIQYCNSSFAEWVQLPMPKIIGRPFSRFVIEEEQEEWALLLQLAWQEEVKAELYLQVTDGIDMPVSLSCNLLTLPDGNSMSLILTDLTEHKKHQEQLKELNANLEQTVFDRTLELFEKQEQLTRILETMAEGVGIIDDKGELVYANEMAQQILGLTEHTSRRRTFNDPKWKNFRVNGSLLPYEEHPLMVTLKTGEKIFDYEIGVQQPGKEVFYISINAAPIRDEFGNITGGVGTFMDVTNRRKMMQQKDDFISVASHELRTPITSLKGALELLERIKDNPTPGPMLPKFVDQANRSLSRVSILIEDLLNATKLSEGQLALNKTVFNLGQLIDDCCTHIRLEGIYEIVSTGDTSVKVIADVHKVDQVLVNLVNNAIKYAPDSKTININVIKQDAMVRVEVCDHGPGIAPEKIPHLFDRYFRVDNSGHQYSGLGLGLYICSEIIKKHGGQIGVDSAIGEGSTFWFTLKAVA